MTGSKQDIIAKLQRDLLPLQGFKTSSNNSILDSNIGQIKNAFPGNTFPLGAIHEFISVCPEDIAATTGFLSVLLNSLMQRGGMAIWIGYGNMIFPPALKAFGIGPDKIIFIELKKEKEMLWAIEEALKCEGLAGVIGCLEVLNFTTSRRLQLAVEKSRVTGFILRPGIKDLTTSACIARWKITSLPGVSDDGMPGVSFPRWNVELLKARNGKPRSWQIECIAGHFRYINKIVPVSIPLQKNTG